METTLEKNFESVQMKHKKHGKTCKCCGHLIIWVKYKGYKCFCDMCKAD